MKYWFLIGALLLVAPAHAEELVRQLSVTGEAKESLKPDLVQIGATVAAQDMDLAQAKKQHDAKLRALLNVAKAYKIEGKYLSTSYGSIQPIWNWENDTRVFKGYAVETTLSLAMKDLDKTGALLEDIVKILPERMDGPVYSVEDTKPVVDRLRVAAVQDARKKADALAREVGLTVAKPISMSDSWQMPQPISRIVAYAPSVGAASDGVSPPQGEQEIQASISIIYEIKE